MVDFNVPDLEVRLVVAVTIMAAVLFVGMGVYGLAAPTRLVAPFDISLGSATSRAEVRAVYGGFGLAIAAILLVSLTSPELRTGILLTVAAALAGMAFGRVVSAIDGRTSFYPNWFYFLVESVTAAVLFVVA
jgi:hypothetical protein